METMSPVAGMDSPSPAVTVSTPAPAPAAAPEAAAAAADPFRETVRPILSARCGQCHDPGGRMYARLPFDDPQVISSHSAGVLRRLKGEDRAAVETWLAGLAPAGAER
jgi:mono/diheme cytochrome c family protein